MNMGGTKMMKVVDLLTPSQKSYVVKLQSKIVLATNSQEVKKHTAELKCFFEEVKLANSVVTGSLFKNSNREALVPVYN